MRPFATRPETSRWMALVVGLWFAGLGFGAVLPSYSQTADRAVSIHEAPKQQSTFFPPSAVARLRANIARDDWTRRTAAEIVAFAEPWMKMSDDALWSLVFGPTLDRSFMVSANAPCPACKKDVAMYGWKFDALAAPWKAICPRCGAQFPKNDFGAFYRSGLDERGAFDAAKADRRLLFNTEHPNPKDPQHLFGVDDGSGHLSGDKRLRFIATYLVWGQWKHAVVSGIKALAAAHVVTGDPVAARKAAIMLDRVADFYPDFDFAKQGWAYDARGTPGFVSVWHDSCYETRELAMAYDQVFEAIRNDAELVAFLKNKAAKHKLPPKVSFNDIRLNIEYNILGKALSSQPKIHNNYPLMEITMVTLQAILTLPGNRALVMRQIDSMIENCTAVDGVTGEKGLAAYAKLVISALPQILMPFDRMDANFLPDLFRRHPSLRKTWRFWLDTWCLESYYPQSGDSGDAIPMYTRIPTMLGAGRFSNTFSYSTKRYEPGDILINPLANTFLWRLYEITGDAGYVQALYQANGHSLNDLPRDLWAEDAAAYRAAVGAVIAREGQRLRTPSVNKQEWHLAILRSGERDHSRAVWLDYDCGGLHGHSDGMNLGLFARGLDLLPDFGYPPVQFGGWQGPAVKWYQSAAAHNTVVIDGRNQASSAYHPIRAADTTLWGETSMFRAMRMSGANLYVNCRQAERTIAVVDLPSAEGFYVLDVFRIAGGREHAKFTHSSFGKVQTQGVSLVPAPDYDANYSSPAFTSMRNFRRDPAPQPGWSVTWNIEDRYGYLPNGQETHFRYTDLTNGTEAYFCEGWIVPGGWMSSIEEWIPRVMVRRNAEKPGLESTFVAVLEPFGKQSFLKSIRRLPLHTADRTPWPDSTVAVEVTHADGTQDLLIAAEVDRAASGKLGPSGAPALVLVQKDWGVTLTGELALVRRDKDGKPLYAAAAHVKQLHLGAVDLSNEQPVTIREWRL